MPESLVALTEGSGKNLHTFQRVIGSNTVEDQSVINGENYLASYIAHMQGTNPSAATAAAHVLQIMAGASLKVRIRRIEMFQVGMATAAAVPIFQLYRLTTAGTGGTAVTPSALDPSDAACGATVMTLPTVKGTEGLQIAEGRPYFMQTLGASNQLINPTLVWDFDRPRSKPLIIAAGVTNGIAVKNVTGVAGATVSFNVWFDESNF